jgi:hypothetical protein
MLRNGTILCLVAVMLLCIGCSEKANTKLSSPHDPTITASHDCQNAPESFFDRYPENWEHALYQRQLMEKYDTKQVAKK